MYQLKIIGRASQKEIQMIDISEQKLKSQKAENLMFFLHKNNIPIASSCYAEGVCHKCKVTIDKKSTLSCEINLLDLFKKQNLVTIEVDYL